MIKAVLFDIDGTLVDSNGAHIEAWQEAFAAAGYVFERDEIHAQIGKGTDMLVPTLIPDASGDLIEALGSAHGAIFKARYLEHVRPFTNSHDLIAHVATSGRKVALVTSASRSEVDYYTSFLDIRAFVDLSTTIEDAERSKPAPDIVRAASKKLAPLRSQELMMVGDAPYDAEAAGKCGIATVALRSGGFRDDELRSAGAIAIYDDVAALLADFDASPLGR